jgi:DNA-binding CsgD family transcriptional regulator
MLATAGAEIDLAAQAGEPERAVERCSEAVRRLRELWDIDGLAALRLVGTALAPVADAAGTGRLSGDTASLERWVAVGESLVAQAREVAAGYVAGIGPLGVEARAWAARVRAEDARLHGRVSPESWQTVVDEFGYGHVFEQARSRFRLAEALLAADDRPRAAAELAAAHEVAVRLGAAPLRTAVEALARRGRLELPGMARPADVGAVLTPREQEVLALMAAGRTNRQIGGELFISEKTASVHVSNILAKLSASGRTEAVAIAAARGLLA